MIRILSGKAAAARVRKISARRAQYAKVEPTVARIIRDVRRNGDRALRRYAEQWDGLKLGDSLRVPEAAIRSAWQSCDADLKRALREAAANIRQFCQRQRPTEWMDTRGGTSTGQLIRPLDSVACYVPAGRYPLVSTLLMTAIPAQVAGVERIVVASPRPHREVLAAAAMLNLREFYRIGGAQAIAALSYGTETLKSVAKIVGPGNIYVTAAKKAVAFDCSIDFLAGPTEALVVMDEGNPQFIAADLIAQAEHDPDALSVFITSREQFGHEVASSLEQMSAGNGIAQRSLKRNGAILVSSSASQSMKWANEIACEHLTVSATDLPLVRNAGSVFVGDYSAQAAGDYASGPNHVLPTGGSARFRGGLSVLDFVKIISVQKLSRPGLRRIAPTIQMLAAAEGLHAHEESIRVRCAHA